MRRALSVQYFTIFGEIIGKRIGLLDGVSYLQYLAPGLIVLWVIPYSYGHTAAGFVGAQFFRFIEELLVSPLPNWVVVLGYVAGGMIRGVLQLTMCRDILRPRVRGRGRRVRSDRPCKPARDNVARLCGVNCHCEPRSMGLHCTWEDTC